MEKELSTQVQTKKEKRTIILKFLLRMVLYLGFGLIAPMGYLIWKFELFSQTSAMKIGGWGIVLVIFTSVFMAKLIKQSVDAVDSVFAKQCLNSVRKVFIPLLAVTLCLYSVRNAWENLIEFFMVLTVCEPIAYVANPFPALLKDKFELKEKAKISNIIDLFWGNRKD